MLPKIFMVNHIIASVVWIGAVYMGAFIDWPAAKKTVPPGKFPFKFIINQGKGVFWGVYIGIVILWVSGIGLTLTTPITSTGQAILIGFKMLCLLIMTLFTMYGTFFTWKKLQLATHEEAFALYKYYMIRAYTTFSCGIAASVLGTFIHPKS